MTTGRRFSVQLAVFGGFLTTRGLVVPFAPLLLFGVPFALFGFWVTVDTHANGADPRSDTGLPGGAESGQPEQ